MVYEYFNYLLAGLEPGGLIPVFLLESDSDNPDYDVDDEDDVCGVDLGDGIGLINTQEDMYLYALLELYKLYKSI